MRTIFELVPKILFHFHPAAIVNPQGEQKYIEITGAQLMENE